MGVNKFGRGGGKSLINLISTGRGGLVEAACISSNLHLFSYNHQLYKRKLPTCLTAEGQN